jgi:hypothetical protein
MLVSPARSVFRDFRQQCLLPDPHHHYQNRSIPPLVLLLSSNPQISKQDLHLPLLFLHNHTRINHNPQCPLRRNLPLRHEFAIHVSPPFSFDQCTRVVILEGSSRFARCFCGAFGKGAGVFEYIVFGVGR